MLSLLERRHLLLVEFLVAFSGGPLLVLAFKQRLVFALVLWITAAAAWHLVRSHGQGTLQDRDIRAEMNLILLRFFVVAVVLSIGTWVLQPNLFLSFPRERPWLWLAVMVGYPLLSVWPQEVLYRRFILYRYGPIFGSGTGFIAASAIAFGYAHIIFSNPVAVTLSTVGGALFAANFSRHRSLPLVWLEHTLYGCLIFTIGLGRYFLMGSVVR